MLKKIALGLSLLLAALATLCGCGSISGGDDPTYTPAAYYQAVNNVYECYYLTSTQEAYNLMAAGLCPQGSMPTPMPMSWEEEYWDYWSSPAYYNTYIPTTYRSHYTSVTIVTLNHSSSFQRNVSTLSSKALYKSSAGGTVSGSKVSTTSFGGGSRTAKSYGGGSRSNSNSSSSGSRSGYSSSYGGGSRSAGRK